jgi:hypothetical protein
MMTMATMEDVTNGYAPSTAAAPGSVWLSKGVGDVPLKSPSPLFPRPVVECFTRACEGKAKVLTTQ